MSFVNDLKVAFRSLAQTKGLAFTVVLTLALGIGANTAIFTLVRGVLLKPLVNRDEDRLIHIRQSAPGVGDDNTTFSLPEIQDLRAGVKTLSAFGDFSTVGFTMIGLGQLSFSDARSEDAEAKRKSRASGGPSSCCVIAVRFRLSGCGGGI
ncbi:MAG TPA: ABC transporter permease [Pyrinomonadaceae bacterium]|jgi:hypothetical protein